MTSYRILVVLFTFAVACGTDPAIPAEDAGDPGVDAGNESVEEMGMMLEDSGTTGPSDMSSTDPDLGGGMDSGSDTGNAASDSGTDAGAADTGSEMGGDAGGDAGTTCDESGFGVTSSTVESIGSDLLIYEAIEGSESDPNFRVFELGIFPEDGGNIGVQTFQFTGESYADCGMCLLAYACTQAGCNTTLMAQSGNVEISEIGAGDGDPFVAEFSDIVFKEVTIDDNTFATTLVPGGLEWCVPSLSASGTNVAN